jgi:hypothetical protein
MSTEEPAYKVRLFALAVFLAAGALSSMSLEAKK